MLNGQVADNAGLLRDGAAGINVELDELEIGVAALHTHCMKKKLVWPFAACAASPMWPPAASLPPARALRALATSPRSVPALAAQSGTHAPTQACGQRCLEPAASSHDAR